MDDVMVIANLGVSGNNDPVPVVPTWESTTGNQTGCTRGHQGDGNRSPRRARTTRAINFLLYGLTLMIPGIAMIIVYFVVFRIPAGDLRWSPADAFVITGAILVGFSVVSAVIGVWQFCISRYESNEPQTDTTIQNQQYSDAPPSYDGIAIDLPDLVVVSVVTDESPPSFATCFPNNRPLPGLENTGFDSVQTDDEDLPPPPEYHEVVKEKKLEKRSSLFINKKTGNAKFTVYESNSRDTPPKDSS